MSLMSLVKGTFKELENYETLEKNQRRLMSILFSKNKTLIIAVRNYSKGIIHLVSTQNFPEN